MSLLAVVVVVAAAVCSPGYCHVLMNSGKILLLLAYPLNLKEKELFAGSLPQKQMNSCQACCLARFQSIASSILDSQLLSVCGMTSDDETPSVSSALLFQVLHINGSCLNNVAYHSLLWMEHGLLEQQMARNG